MSADQRLLRFKFPESLKAKIMAPSKVSKLRGYAESIEGLMDELDDGVEYAETIGDEDLADALCSTRMDLERASINLRIKADVMEAISLGLELESLED